MNISKRPPIPRIAIALLHFYDKDSFLTKLALLDEVCQELPVTIYIYEAPHAISQQLVTTDLQRWSTPVCVVPGETTSKAAAYNALFRAITTDHVWTIIIEGAILRDEWWIMLQSMKIDGKVGLLGGRVDLGKNSLSAHDTFWGSRNRQPRLLGSGDKLIAWIDLRFWLVKTRVIKQLNGFEERYFMGDMFVRDFCWRLSRMGISLGIISKTLVKSRKEPSYPPQRTLARYYNVRNQWLFARLRLSWIQGIAMMMVRTLVEGVWLRRLGQSDYKQGWVDGMTLFFKRN